MSKDKLTDTIIAAFKAGFISGWEAGSDHQNISWKYPGFETALAENIADFHNLGPDAPQFTTIPRCSSSRFVNNNASVYCDRNSGHVGKHSCQIGSGPDIEWD